MKEAEIETYDCKTCGYRGPLLLAHSRSLANKHPLAHVAISCLGIIPVVGFFAHHFLAKPPECCPNCGEQTATAHWSGAVSNTEMDLWALKQKKEDEFKLRSDKRLVPVLVLIIAIAVYYIYTSLQR